MAAHHITTFVVDDRLPWPDVDLGGLESGPLEQGFIVDGSERVDCTFGKIAPRAATVKSELRGAEGSRHSVELGNGLRRMATVAWARGGELGLTFDEPLDIVALINRNLVAQPAERRCMPRVELRCPVHVKWCERLEPATMRNISCSGMQVEGEFLPAPGTLVSLYVEGMNLPPAELMWQRGNLAGFEFFEELNWSSMIAWVRQMSRGPKTRYH